MKKNLPYITIIILFIGVLTFDYLRHGIPAVFFSDLGGIYPDLINTQNLFFSFISGWRDSFSQPFYWLNAQSHYWMPLVLFFIEDIWLKIKLTQIAQILLAAIFSCNFSFYLFKNRKIALISGLVYASTPFFFSMLNGHNGLTWSYVLLPIALFLIEKMFLFKKHYWALLAGMFISLSTFISSIQFIFYTGLPIFIYLAIRYIMIVLQEKKNPLLNNYLKLLAIVGVAVFSFSAFFLFPSFFEYQPYTQSESEVSYRRDDFVTNFYAPNLKENLSLQNKEHIVSAEFGYDISKLPNKFVNFYIFISIIAGLSVILVLTKKVVFKNQFNYWPFFIAAVFALALSFGKQIFLFNFFNSLLPFFWTIRTPGRFLIFYVLFVSIMSPVVIWNFFTFAFYKITKSKKIFETFRIFFLAAMVILIFYIANFYGQFLLTFKTVENMDSHYDDLSIVNQKLSELNKNNDYRVIDLIIEKDGNPNHLKTYSAGQRSIANSYDIIWRFKDDPNLAKILGMLNIKYILTAPWPAWPKSSNTLFPPMEKRLESDDSFELIYTADSGIKIWEDKWALPRTYQATPILIVGPPSSVSSLLDLFPDNNNFALFSANQIGDKNELEKIIKDSSLIFINEREEKKPSYLTSLNVGFVYNSDFYTNPQNHSNAAKEIKEIIKSSHKPIIEKTEGGRLSSINLISEQTFDNDALGIDLIKNTANISDGGKNGQRFEPSQFDVVSETVYKLTSEEPGRVMINFDAISLFDGNYVKISSSADNKNYQDILVLRGDDDYPEFYEGPLLLDKRRQENLFLKTELFSVKETSREIYDSRIEKLSIDFIEKSDYNYINVTKEDSIKIFNSNIDGNRGLVLKDYRSGKFDYMVDKIDIDKKAIVNTEIYTPEWILSSDKVKIRSLPVNIFNNGFLAGQPSAGDSFIIKYKTSLARGIGLFLTLATIVSLAVTFKKRI